MKNKKPRKKYVPKVIPVSPLLVVSANNSPLTEQECTSVMLEARLGFQALLQGTATHEQWKTVTGTLNVAVALDELTFQRAYVRELQLSLHAHAHCGARHILKGRFGYTGEEMEHVKVALEIHAAQLAQATFKELRYAKARVEDDIRHRRFETSAQRVAKEMKKL